MWLINLLKRKKKEEEKPVYVRNDDVEEYREKVRDAFGSVNYGKIVAVAIDKQCMAMTKKGTRCKNKALEDDTYCYRHRAIHG